LFYYDEHGAMILYDKMLMLSNITSTTNASVKFISASFNQNTWEVIHVSAVYKPLEMQIAYFISILKTILKKIPIDCPTIVIGDFNVNMLTNTS